MAFDLTEAEERIKKLEDCVTTVNIAVQKMLGQMSSIELILKWVVLPLIIIVGGLVGIKIAFPTF